VGDHATGIAEQVIYLVTGSFPDEDRIKGEDAASLQR
jgi:phosphate transport system protein